MNRLDTLDHILELLTSKDGFIRKVDLIGDDEILSDVKNITDYLQYLLNSKYIEYNSTVDSLKVTIDGAVFISQGGFKKESQRQIYDIKLKWTFWILSLCISLSAILMAGINLYKNNNQFVEKVEIEEIFDNVTKIESSNKNLNMRIDSLISEIKKVKLKLENN